MREVPRMEACKHSLVLVDYDHPHGILAGVSVAALQASDPSRTRPVMSLTNPAVGFAERHSRCDPSERVFGSAGIFTMTGSPGRSRAASNSHPSLRTNSQCRKCLTPVNSIAKPCSSQAAMLSASRSDPPG
jgi:hypothetical protein